MVAHLTLLDSDSHMVKETLNNLSVGNLRLWQAEKGYRYSLDPIFLARFVPVQTGAKIVDLGAGCGILPLLLARISTADKFIGIERQEALAERATRNVELNELTDKITILSADIRRVNELLPAESADVVVTNPPYRHSGSGRIAPNDERAAARHELAGGLSEFVTAATWLLKNGGTFAAIYLAERLTELMVTLTAARIEPKRLRMIHSYRGEVAKLVLIEGRKGGRPGLVVEAPLFVYRENASGRDFSDEVLAMYDN